MSNNHFLSIIAQKLLRFCLLFLIAAQVFLVNFAKKGLRVLGFRRKLLICVFTGGLTLTLTILVGYSVFFDREGSVDQSDQQGESSSYSYWEDITRWLAEKLKTTVDDYLVRSKDVFESPSEIDSVLTEPEGTVSDTDALIHSLNDSQLTEQERSKNYRAVLELLIRDYPGPFSDPYTLVRAIHVIDDRRVYGVDFGDSVAVELEQTVYRKLIHHYSVESRYFQFHLHDSRAAELSQKKADQYQVMLKQYDPKTLEMNLMP